MLLFLILPMYYVKYLNFTVNEDEMFCIIFRTRFVSLVLWMIFLRRSYSSLTFIQLLDIFFMRYFVHTNHLLLRAQSKKNWAQKKWFFEINFFNNIIF